MSAGRLRLIAAAACVSSAACGSVSTMAAGTAASAVPVEITRISSAAWRVRAAGAAYIRLHFERNGLPPAVSLTISDSTGRSVQHLDAKALAAWSDNTAYFNGDSVFVSARMREDSPVAIGAVEAKLHALTVETETDARSLSNIDRLGQIIGTDDRVHSTDRAVGRIEPVGCTGWLISIGIGLTAGHCLDPAENQGKAQILEFDVPASLPNGTVQHPPASEQFPMSWAAVDWKNNNLGDDWGVFAVGSNDGGTSAFQDHPYFRPTADKPVEVGQRLGVTGYGLDTHPPGKGPTGENAQSQTEQFSRGSLLAFQSTYLTHDADTQGASSGSPILIPGSRLAFGIHTAAVHSVAQCVAVPECNGGTNFTNAAFKMAMGNKSRVGEEVTYFVDWMTPTWVLHPDGSATSPYPTVDDALAAHIGAGFTLDLVEGHYEGREKTYASNGPDTSLILRALTGPVTLGPVPRPLGNAP